MQGHKISGLLTVSNNYARYFMSLFNFDSQDEEENELTNGNSGNDQSNKGKSKQETLYPYKQVTAEMQQEMKKSGVDWNLQPKDQKTAEARIKAQRFSDNAYGRSPNDVTRLEQAEKLANMSKDKPSANIVSKTSRSSHLKKREGNITKNPNLYAADMAIRQLGNGENYRGIIDQTRESVNNISSAALGTVKQGYDDKGKSEIKYLKMINDQMEKINSSNASDRMKKIRLDKLEKKRVEYEDRLRKSEAGSEKYQGLVENVIETAQDDDSAVGNFLQGKTDAELKGYSVLRNFTKYVPEVGLAAANKITRAVSAFKSAGEAMGETINNNQKVGLDKKIRAGFKAGAVDLAASYVPVEKVVSGMGKAASKAVGETAKTGTKDQLSKSLDVAKREGANFGAEYFKEKVSNKIQNSILQSESPDLKKKDESKNNATLNYFGGKLIK